MEPETSIAVIDYGLGNVRAIVNMFRKIGIAAFSTRDPGQLRRAAKLVLPGVGSFDAGISNLRDFGLRPVLEELVLGDKVPILGICLGMQLFSQSSEEGRCSGLGWIEGKTVRFRFEGEDGSLRIPHMGWNEISVCAPNALVTDPGKEWWFYFAHSYHVECADPANRLADTRYGRGFTSMIGRGNILGVQFHPEKSHRYGMELLRNFATWKSGRMAKAA
jgi:glutamine amidotransferase